MRVKNITELQRITVEEFKGIAKIPVIIVLDNIRSLNNVGSVFRCSDAFCVEAIYLCGITATPPHVDIHKTALGAEDSVSWEYFEHTSDAVAKLREQEIIICAVEQTTDSISLDRFDFNRTCRYALILGNEVKGVQQSIVDLCDYSIEIPQYGTKHSLNVSMATGIVVWEFFKNLKF